jgi:hypothetical protein
MKKTIFTIFIFNLFLLSCQKDFTIDDATNTTNQTLVDDSTLLSMYVEIDTTAPANLDTLAKALYSYDDLKRITKYDWVYYTNGLVPSPIGLRWKNLYFYNGADTLPYKEIDSTFEQGNITTSTIFHTYLNGKLMLDSFSTGAKNKYVYLPAKTIDTLFGYTSTTPNLEIIGYTVTYRQTNNSNIISEIDSLFLADFSTNPVTYPLYFVDNYTNTYDNYFNPLYKFKDINPITFNGYFPKLDDIVNKGKNNNINYTMRRRSAFGSGNNLDEQTSSTYVYKANGYPKIVRTRDMLNPLYSTKAFYYYTK